MNLVTNMQLIYAGEGAHSIKALDKADWLSKLSKSDNKKLAEWAIDRISYNNKDLSRMQYLGLDLTSVAALNHIDKLHRDYEQDLRLNHFEQNPVIDDEEAWEMLFEEQISSLLEEIPEKVDANIDLRF